MFSDSNIESSRTEGHCKRQRNISNWKQNVAKQFRNSGQEYAGHGGKVKDR
jgi:hypothetical protein